MRWGLGVALLLAWLLLPNQGRAQLGGPIQVMTASTTEQWIWQRLRAGETADLNTRCGVTLDPRANDDARWRDPCRQVSAKFLEWLLTGPDWRVAPAHRGVRMVGARVADPIDLTGADVKAEAWLHQGRFEREVWLERARFSGLLSLNGAVFRGGLNADGLRVGDSLLLRDGAVVTGGVASLRRANIEGNLAMDKARFEAGINANSLKLGGTLLLSDGVVVTGGAVNLVGADIAGVLDMSRAHFEGAIIADSLKLGGSLLMQEAVLLTAAAQLGDTPPVLNLRQAEIAGSLVMLRARIQLGIIAESLKLGGNLLLIGSTFTVAPDFSGATIGRIVELTSTALPGLDLSGALVKGDLRLSVGDASVPTWTGGGALYLRNTSVQSIEDAEGAWPHRIDLKGFTYARLGGTFGAGAVDMLRRPAESYAAWLARDPVLARQPYEQLAGVFRAAGDRDRADAILTAYRDRERTEAWRDGQCWNTDNALWQRPLAWGNEDCRNALWLGLLWATIGYGIGDGPFRIVWWVLGMTLLGALVLGWAKPAGRRGLAWRAGASLDQLLPIISLNKEFDEYFHDPKRERLHGWQLGYFAAQALVGFLLASFLVAGLSGLTQGQ